jgi:signal transduction histidine kinase
VTEAGSSSKRAESPGIGSGTLPILRFLQKRSRPWLIVMSFILLIIVGFADYLTGFERSLLVFYLLPVSLAAWFVSWRFAVLICLLSVAVWIAGDIAAGAIYSSSFIPSWNAAVAVTFFLVVIWLLQKLRSLLDELESRIRQRTAALRREMKARERLEKEVAEAAERESQRIGHELHDSLGQHLTATSLALQVLSGKLTNESLPFAPEADQAVELVEDAIDLTRSIAKGLFPLELEGEGLPGALLELSRIIQQRHRVVCELKCSTVRLPDSTVATHLYRIAQEAVRNAIKHGHVSRIAIELSAVGSGLTLSIKDDGIGLPESLPENRGLGLRIMSSRAGMIGASLSVNNDPTGGTLVTCRLPMAGKAIKEMS